MNSIQGRGRLTFAASAPQPAYGGSSSELIPNISTGRVPCGATPALPRFRLVTRDPFMDNGTGATEGDWAEGGQEEENAPTAPQKLLIVGRSRCSAPRFAEGETGALGSTHDPESSSMLGTPEAADAQPQEFQLTATPRSPAA